ncbi:MAG: hypothetical protein IPP20_11260 [Gemmatimonadetes bacterium]|nr:hypothetical protein [Gemmatimonadota bacterium]
MNPAKVHETGFSAVTNAAQREARRGVEGEKTAELMERVGQAYRILFTRALKGVALWIPDAETREHVRSSIA